MRYSNQLEKANKLVEDVDIVKDVKFLWLQELTDTQKECNFIEERLEDEEDVDGIESLYDLFIAIAESQPRAVWLKIYEKEELPRLTKIFDREIDQD